MLMMLPFLPPLAMPQQVQTELSPVSGVEQARQLSVTHPTYSLCFSLSFPPPKRAFPAPNLRHTISLILAKGIKQPCCVSVTSPLCWSEENGIAQINNISVVLCSGN